MSLMSAQYPNQRAAALLSADANVGLLEDGQIKEVIEQIKDGLPNSRQRRYEAKVCEAHYQYLGADYIPKREAELDRDYAQRPKRVAYLTRKAIDTLGRRLYQPGPNRKLTSKPGAANEATLKDVGDWLADAYEAGRINSVMDAANKRAILGHASAIQVGATGDASRPLRFWVYSPHEFEVFCSPDDPTIPWAVVVASIKSADPNRNGKAQVKRVYTLYTTTKVYVFESKPFIPGTAPEEGKTELVSNGKPHGYGVLPFAFFHAEIPIDQFWSGGIGPALVRAEKAINVQLSDLAELIQKFSCPDFLARNIASTFRYEKRPGKPQTLPPRESAAQGEEVSMGPPELFYIQPQLNVEEIWQDTTRMIKRTFTDLDVPVTASWDDTQSPTSGLQVIAQDAPYLEYLNGRQLIAQVAEDDLARVALAVAGNYYGFPQFVEVASVARMQLDFPAYRSFIPTPEQNQDQQWKVEWGLMSQIEVIMQQRGISREQAEEVAAQVAQDRALIESLQRGTTPITPLTPTDGMAADPNATTGTVDAQAGGQASDSPAADSATNTAAPSASN